MSHSSNTLMPAHSVQRHREWRHLLTIMVLIYFSSTNKYLCDAQWLAPVVVRLPEDDSFKARISFTKILISDAWETDSIQVITSTRGEVLSEIPVTTKQP